jgi:integrase
VCVSEEEAKNLAEAESRSEKWAAGATAKPTPEEVKGKIVEYAWWLKTNGYSDITIRVNVSCLRTLVNRDANLYNPESVKDVMAKQKWADSRKHGVIAAYNLFVKMVGLQWEKPTCHVSRKVPFIPTEQELDALIAGCGRKTATFLQLLKETAMRAGEARTLSWTDIDMERRTITLNTTEKRGNPRMFSVSTKLINMLATLPKRNEKVFANTAMSSVKSSFYQSRKILARKLQNPRLLRITFHTFRHWKATTLYHQTKDPLYVKEFLGHRKLDTTLLYIQIEQALYKGRSDEFTVKVASKPEEIKALLEVGFEYICGNDGLMYFRKRK